jgi:hypothetical protein
MCEYLMHAVFMLLPCFNEPCMRGRDPKAKIDYLIFQYQIVEIHQILPSKRISRKTASEIYDMTFGVQQSEEQGRFPEETFFAKSVNWTSPRTMTIVAADTVLQVS